MCTYLSFLNRKQCENIYPSSVLGRQHFGKMYRSPTPFTNRTLESCTDCRSSALGRSKWAVLPTLYLVISIFTMSILALFLFFPFFLHFLPSLREFSRFFLFLSFSFSIWSLKITNYSVVVRSTEGTRSIEGWKITHCCELSEKTRPKYSAWAIMLLLYLPL